MVRSPFFARKQSGGAFVYTNEMNSTGEILFVHSGTGVNEAGGGNNPDKPLATIDYAIGLCTANKGDRIVVLPGHAESIAAAAGIALDVAGVSIVGLGTGSLKPTITFTAVAADINVSALNCRVSGLRCVSAIDNLVNFIDVDEEFCTIENCDFVGPATFEALGFINLATTKDNFWIRGCNFQQAADPAGTDGAVDTGCIFIIDSENIYIDDCHFYGFFETAMIHNRTTACKNLWVRNCYGVSLLSGSEPFQLVDGANGACVGGGFVTPAETAATEATLIGTLGNGFFILGTQFGNDGAAGGQGGIIAATAS